MEKEVRALRKRNEEMEKVVGGMRGEWGREMEKLGFGKGKGKGGEEDLAGEEFLLLGDVERELGRLEEWVRIVEGGDEEAEVEAEPGREEEEEEEGRYVGSDETGVERDKGKGKEVAREESAAASPVK